MSSRTLSYANKINSLDEFSEWFGDVVVENLDWADVFEKYKSEDTVFYCDPPYVAYDDYYVVNPIDHEVLVDGLAGLERDWIYSYEYLPDTFENVYVIDSTRNGSSTVGSVDRRRMPRSG